MVPLECCLVLSTGRLCPWHRRLPYLFWLSASCGHIPTGSPFTTARWKVVLGLGQGSVRMITRVTLDDHRAKIENRSKKHKQRLDELCQERFPQYSRSIIQSWILQGKVLVDGNPIGKAGANVSAKSEIAIIAELPKYVSRGTFCKENMMYQILLRYAVPICSILWTHLMYRAGYKLEAALEYFACDITGKVALDAGLSTGGFTDCLLQQGAACVYGVDVGYGQVAEKIRTDNRVHILERTNLRHLRSLPQLVDIVTLDLSFISILLVMPAICTLMKEHSTLITLIKPQFEARRSQVGSGGIVRNTEVHKEVLERVITGIKDHGFFCRGWIPSPLKGVDGNIEFLACFDRNQNESSSKCS